MSMDKTNQQTLKELRAARRQWVDQASAASRSQKKILQAIEQVLRAGPATVPQIAAAVALPTATVLWFVAGMKKYGRIIEAGQDDSYFRYALAADRPVDAESDTAEA